MGAPREAHAATSTTSGSRRRRLEPKQKQEEQHAHPHSAAEGPARGPCRRDTGDPRVDGHVLARRRGRESARATAERQDRRTAEGGHHVSSERVSDRDTAHAARPNMARSPVPDRKPRQARLRLGSRCPSSRRDAARGAQHRNRDGPDAVCQQDDGQPPFRGVESARDACRRSRVRSANGNEGGRVLRPDVRRPGLGQVRAHVSSVQFARSRPRSAAGQHLPR